MVFKFYFFSSWSMKFQFGDEEWRYLSICNYECGTRGESILRDAISWNMWVLYLRHLPHAGCVDAGSNSQGVTVLCLWNSSNPPCANPEYSVNSPNFCWTARGVVEVSRAADCSASAFMLLEPLIATSRLQTSPHYHFFRVEFRWMSIIF